ncbi:relaxin-3-like [Lampris incognitus]|uniref:relaxin-3-like n=1 Tax=Lampris incognitus TaxID=2546036 RepID=UPI0024B5E685|nr:relaxin-3-like [Lampris incognitus]
MKFLLLPVMLLCVLCVAEVTTQDNTHVLRLCGREFVRAVVYTCGGSRWRRLTELEKTLPNSGVEQSFHQTRDVVPVMGRHQRELNEALTIMCCQLGCRKSDLSMLC